MMMNGNCNAQGAVDVAVAVLVYGQKLLLATRLHHQHQGGKLEFVGGKFEHGETPAQALVREVKEELGLDIACNLATKMGRICHDYGQKKVRLHVYHVPLTKEQYFDFKSKTTGLDGQAIGFYDKAWVCQNASSFPSANQAIVRWLALPSVVVISHGFYDFDGVADFVQAYRHLPVGSTLYLRLQADFDKTLATLQALHQLRPDLAWILPFDFYCVCQAKLPNIHIVALKVPQNDVQDFLCCLESDKADKNTTQNDGQQGVDVLTLSQKIVLDYLRTFIKPDNAFDFDKFFALAWVLSCHNADEVDAANRWACHYPLLGVFVSPVYQTKTHPTVPALGWQGLAKLADLSDVPVVALGGLTGDDGDKARQHGALAVSGIRGFKI